MARYTIDPITRIEGHLRIDVEIEGGKVKDAWSSAQLFRGLALQWPAAAFQELVPNV